MTTLYCMSYVLFLVSAFVLGHDYPLLYVLRSVFGVSLYVLGVCRFMRVLLSAFSVCCFLTLVFVFCFRP